jgi:RNA 3'-terminal phosphate cyclase
MISIDGSFRVGGDQILRAAQGLSLVTCHPFRIDKIRAC